MPILPIPKHEAFAQVLARGSSAAAAYVEAGYKENRHNAATLARKQHILTRVGELQEEQLAIHQQATEALRRWRRLAFGHANSVRGGGSAFGPWCNGVRDANSALDICVSICALLACYRVVVRSAATRVVSLFYLTPPVTALLAWALFNERQALGALVDMVFCVIGIFLVNWQTAVK
jgi:hypothetical protein